jgi:hypothetical protein
VDTTGTEDILKILHDSRITLATTHVSEVAYQAFVNRALELGAANVLHPGSDRGHAKHIHVEWPRDPVIRG